MVHWCATWRWYDGQKLHGYVVRLVTLGDRRSWTGGGTKNYWIPSLASQSRVSVDSGGNMDLFKCQTGLDFHLLTQLNWADECRTRHVTHARAPLFVPAMFHRHSASDIAACFVDLAHLTMNHRISRRMIIIILLTITIIGRKYLRTRSIMTLNLNRLRSGHVTTPRRKAWI